MNKYIWLCIHSALCMYLCVSVYMSTYMYMYVFVNMANSIYTYTHMYENIYIYIYMYTHTRKCIHTAPSFKLDRNQRPDVVGAPEVSQTHAHCCCHALLPHAAGICVWHDPFTCVTWLVHMCDMPHSYVSDALFKYVTCHIHVGWLVQICDMSHLCGMACSHVWHVSFMWDSLCTSADMTHSWLIRDSFVTYSWLIPVATRGYLMLQVRVCGMTHSYMWHASFPCVIWLVGMCWHDAFMTWLRP